MTSDDKVPIIGGAKRKFHENSKIKLLGIFAIATTVVVIVTAIVYYSTKNLFKLDCHSPEFRCFEKPGDVKTIFVTSPANSSYDADVILADGVEMTHFSDGAVHATVTADRQQLILVDGARGFVWLNWTRSAAPISIRVTATPRSVVVRVSTGVDVHYGRNCVVNVTRTLNFFNRGPCQITIEPGKGIPNINVTIMENFFILSSVNVYTKVYFRDGYSRRPKNGVKNPRFKNFTYRGDEDPEIFITTADETTMFLGRDKPQMLVTVTAGTPTLKNCMYIEPAILQVLEYSEAKSEGLCFSNGQLVMISNWKRNVSIKRFDNNFFLTTKNYDMKLTVIKNGAKFHIQDKLHVGTLSCSNKDGRSDVLGLNGTFRLAQNRYVHAASYELGELYADLQTNDVNMTDGILSPPTPRGERFLRGPLGTVTLVNNIIANMTLAPGNFTHVNRNTSFITPVWTIDVVEVNNVTEVNEANDVNGMVLVRTTRKGYTARVGPLDSARLDFGEVSLDVNETDYEMKGFGSSIQMLYGWTKITGNLATVLIDPFPEAGIKNGFEEQRIFQILKNKLLLKIAKIN